MGREVRKNMELFIIKKRSLDECVDAFNKYIVAVREICSHRKVSHINDVVKLFLNIGKAAADLANKVEYELGEKTTGKIHKVVMADGDLVQRIYIMTQGAAQELILKDLKSEEVDLSGYIHKYLGAMSGYKDEVENQIHDYEKIFLKETKQMMNDISVGDMLRDFEANIKVKKVDVVTGEESMCDLEDVKDELLDMVRSGQARCSVGMMDNKGNIKKFDDNSGIDEILNRYFA